MGLFGKPKVSEFDVVQDASLTKVNKSIKVLSGNDQALLSRISQLSSKLSQLDKTLSSLVTEHNKQVSLNEDQEKRLIKLEGVQVKNE